MRRIYNAQTASAGTVALFSSVQIIRLNRNIPTKVHIWVGMQHVFMLLEQLPETRHARAHVVEWLRELSEPMDSVQSDRLYQNCVEVLNLSAFTGDVAIETNDLNA